MKRLLAIFAILALALPATATYAPEREFYLEVAKGNIPGHSLVHKFGANAAVGASIEDISDGSTVYSWPTSAVQLEAISTSANDGIAGSGARQITVVGLDASWDEQTVTITMNGTSASSATAETWIRVYRAYVSQSGTYGSTTAGGNAGTITIRASGAGATHAQILFTTTGLGQTRISRYTVPDGFKAYILSWNYSVDSNQTCDLYFFQRTNGDDTSAPMDARRLIHYGSGVSGPHMFRPATPLGPYAARTDLWWAGNSNGASSEVEVDFEILLVAV